MKIETQKISPFLWFDDQAEEAAKFYTSIFKNSAIGTISHYGEGAPKPKGSVLVVNFTIEGQQFMALNGGPQFKFSPAISFVVHCDDQAEIDYLWDKLSAGGAPGQCGWLTDRFGLSWQVVPRILGELMSKPNSADRIFAAIMGMTKFDIATLRAAAEEQAVK